MARLGRRSGWLSLLLLAACSSAPPPPPEPQMVEFMLGQTRRVMQGRAAVWFAQPDEAWREDLNAIVTGVRVEVSCKGERHGLFVFQDKPSDSVCGIRLQLLRLDEPDTPANPRPVFRAYLRVSPE